MAVQKANVGRIATPQTDVELTDAARRTLAIRLAGLATAVYFARFLLGLVKYVLDACMLLLLATSAAAALGSSVDKTGTVSQLLTRLEPFVDPLYTTIADRGLSTISGPLKTMAQYLGFGPDTVRS
ncbi:hypothetical protein GGF46_004343 [Coemansia sp. RSA 552]|nr:hypothetical protein GGF46_004343 [Coemansia sp. RSA 552]